MERVLSDRRSPQHHVWRTRIVLMTADGAGTMAIRDYLDAHNADPKPFRWTAPANTIIAKHQRGKRLLESIH